MSDMRSQLSEERAPNCHPALVRPLHDTKFVRLAFPFAPAAILELGTALQIPLLPRLPFSVRRSVYHPGALERHPSCLRAVWCVPTVG